MNEQPVLFQAMKKVRSISISYSESNVYTALAPRWRQVYRSCRTKLYLVSELEVYLPVQIVF